MSTHEPLSDRASTGITGLDEILPRWLSAQSSLSCPRKSGPRRRTTLALQFLLDGVRHKERVLYVTLSETTEELMDVARSHGLALDGIAVHGLDVAGGRSRIRVAIHLVSSVRD